MKIILSGKFLLFLLLLVTISKSSIAQVGGADLPDELVYGGLRFKVNAAWVSFYGGQSTAIKTFSEFDYSFYGITYHYPFSKENDNYNFIGGGIFTQGYESFFRNYNFHFTYGFRKPKHLSNLSYSFGPAITYGWWPNGRDLQGTQVYRKVISGGIYSEAEWIFKPTYDLGIGPGFFVNIDSYRSTFGLKVVLYFSNSYKGKSKNATNSD